MILAFLASSLGRYVAIAFGAVALIGGFSMRERNIGATKTLAKIEANNDAVVRKAAVAAAKSIDPAAPGLRLKYRDD